MNRLSKLIVRRVGPFAPAAAWPGASMDFDWVDESANQWLDDLRLFATGWVGGLIFFGTLLA